MEFAALSTGQVSALLGFTAAAVIGLYLLKLRRRAVPVPYIVLWESLLAEGQATRWFSRLKRFLSLLIALTAVAMLATALGDPRPSSAFLKARNTVVLVDTGLSMQATDVPPSRLDAARDKALELVASMRPQDQMLIAQMHGVTTPVSTMTSDKRALKRAIKELQATDVCTDFASAYRFALDVLGGRPNPQIVLISDGVFRRDPELERRLYQPHVDIGFMPVGRRHNNLAITAFSARRHALDKDRSELLVELGNSSTKDQTVRLTLLADQSPIHVEHMQLQAGKQLRQVYDDISAVDRMLEARIDMPNDKSDDLTADNRAYARLPERNKARVLCVTRGNLYLEAALLLDEYLTVETVKPAEYAGATGHDVVIFDNFVPTAPPQTPALYLYPKPEDGHGGPLRVLGTLRRPLFDKLQRDHPLLRWTALRDVNVAEALNVQVQPEDQVVAADRRGPLIVAGTRDQNPFVALTFDLRRSDLPLRAAWPLLLLNIVKWFSSESDAYLASWRTGQAGQLALPTDVKEVTVLPPDNSSHRLPVTDGRAVFAPIKAGFYTLRTTHGQDIIAVNPEAQEPCGAAPRKSLDVAGHNLSLVSPPEKAAVEELWVYLLLAALFILFVEWFTYHRRWTV